MDRDWNALRLSPKLLLLLFLGLGLLLTLQLLAGKPADAAGVQTTLRAGNSGKCLTTYPGSFSNGAIAYQWTCGGGDNIEVEDAGGGWHYIKFIHSDKCLTVNGFAWWDGAILDQWDCLGQANQKWSGAFVEGIFEVHASQANPTKCITVHAESTANGAWVNQWQCVYRANQAWIMDPAGPTATPTRTRTPTPTPTATPIPGDGELTITKVCDPVDDDGEFIIRLDGIVQGTIGCGESIGPIVLAAGTHTVTETGAAGTDLNDYNRDFGDDCNDDGEVVVEADEEAVCEVINELEAP